MVPALLAVFFDFQNSKVGVVFVRMNSKVNKNQTKLEFLT
jgi:hypothetical protein